MLTIADLRTTHSREARENLKEHIGDKLFDTVIRQSIAYAESAERGVSILDHKPARGVDYISLAEEVLGRLELTAARQQGPGDVARSRVTDAAPGESGTPEALGRQGRTLDRLGTPTTG